MRVVYMGTPDFAVLPLNRLIEEGYEIPLVICQPDRPRGRGKKVLPPPVKVLAEKSNIPVYQPDSKEDSRKLYHMLCDLKPDIIIVAAYGRILPGEILNLPKLGCVNIHASLLPRHRGAAPIQYSILSGDKETGVTLMYMTEGMDEGDIMSQRAMAIDQKTAGELFEELTMLGADLLTDTLPHIKDGTAKRIKQDEDKATYAPKITKADCKIDFGKTASEIERQIRAMNPRPRAYAMLNDNEMKVLSAKVMENGQTGVPGQIKKVDREGILIATGGGDLLVTQIQMPGKQILDVDEYIKGNKIEIGTILG